MRPALARLQLDEIWSFVYAKQKNVPEAKKGSAGDAWTWVAIDADTKLVPSWRVGDRSTETAIELVSDLSKRLRNRVQITTDGHWPCLEAIGVTDRVWDMSDITAFAFVVYSVLATRKPT
jgi:IS1 family transposase